uniref:Uncharacterized protein n=1 Tax=viral metagenome TaxID=1070528 RepID=A0A2V0RA99_9ZZZZ
MFFSTWDLNWMRKAVESQIAYKRAVDFFTTSSCLLAHKDSKNIFKKGYNVDNHDFNNYSKPNIGDRKNKTKSIRKIGICLNGPSPYFVSKVGVCRSFDRVKDMTKDLKKRRSWKAFTARAQVSKLRCAVVFTSGKHVHYSLFDDNQKRRGKGKDFKKKKGKIEENQIEEYDEWEKANLINPCNVSNNKKPTSSNCEDSISPTWVREESRSSELKEDTLSKETDNKDYRSLSHKFHDIVSFRRSNKIHEVSERAKLYDKSKHLKSQDFDDNFCSLLNVPENCKIKGLLISELDEGTSDCLKDYVEISKITLNSIKMGDECDVLILEGHELSDNLACASLFSFAGSCGCDSIIVTGEHKIHDSLSEFLRGTIIKNGKVFSVYSVAIARNNLKEVSHVLVRTSVRFISFSSFWILINKLYLGHSLFLYLFDILTVCKKKNLQ